MGAKQCVVDVDGARHCVSLPEDAALDDPDIVRRLRLLGIVLNPIDRPLPPFDPAPATL